MKLLEQIANVEAYLWATPNSHRVSILFDELKLDYHVHPINIRSRMQFAPEILALNPYCKVPIVTWSQGDSNHRLFESGAILLHFGEASPDLLPPTGPARDEVMIWFMVAMTSLGPMTGSAHHWTELAPSRSALAIDHHVAMVKRVYDVLEEQLTAREYLAGTYSLADIAAYPWVAVHKWADLSLVDYPGVAAWYERVGGRSSVMRGMRVPHGAKLE